MTRFWVEEARAGLAQHSDPMAGSLLLFHPPVSCIRVTWLIPTCAMAVITPIYGCIKDTHICQCIIWASTWDRCTVVQTKYLRLTATLCNSPQHTATHCNTWDQYRLLQTHKMFYLVGLLPKIVLQYVAKCHSVLQCITAIYFCESVLQTQVSFRKSRCSMSQYVAVCCCVLQCIAMYCSMLQMCISQVSFRKSATHNERWGAGVEYHFQEI